MKKGFLLTLLPLAFMVAACGGNEPAPASSSHATGLSVSSQKTSEESSAAGDTSTSAQDPSSLSSLPETFPLDIYIKSNKSLEFWQTNEAVSYAYCWDGTGDSATNKQFYEVTYEGIYDDNTTLHFTVNLDYVTEHVLVLRCDPAVVTTTPATFPETGVWSQTADADISQQSEEGTPILKWIAEPGYQQN